MEAHHSAIHYGRVLCVRISLKSVSTDLTCQQITLLFLLPKDCFLQVWQTTDVLGSSRSKFESNEERVYVFLNSDKTFFCNSATV